MDGVNCSLEACSCGKNFIHVYPCFTICSFFWRFLLFLWQSYIFLCSFKIFTHKYLKYSAVAGFVHIKEVVLKENLFTSSRDML